MAIWLGQIHRVKELHSRGQRSWLWTFEFTSSGLGELLETEDLSFLATRVSFPGMEFETKAYFAGGLEYYHPGKMKKGGPVTATFIEVEGGLVDNFFREWNEKVDHGDIVEEGGRIVGTRIRSPKKEYTGWATVKLQSRFGRVVRKYNLVGLTPSKIGPYELTYDGSGMLLLPVVLNCDYVSVG